MSRRCSSWRTEWRLGDDVKRGQSRMRAIFESFQTTLRLASETGLPANLSLTSVLSWALTGSASNSMKCTPLQIICVVSFLGEETIGFSLPLVPSNKSHRHN